MPSRNGKGNRKTVQPRTAKKRAEFLSAYRDCGNIRVAAEAVEIGRQSHYDWMKADPQYRDQFETATREAIEALETEARTRATIGALRPVFYKGEAISIPCQVDDAGSFEDPMHAGRYRKLYLESTKSDILLMFLLKKLDPSYREGYKPPPEDKYEKSWMELSRDEATVRKAMESIDRLPIDDDAKQALRDSITVDE